MRRRKLADRGRRISEALPPVVSRIVDHIDHVATRGIDHVGIGSGFDGVQVVLI